MTWRVAESLEVLRRQINEKFPDRDKSWDGGIGDEAHASRDSDHNPWVREDGTGIVTARDYTHDPEHGFDSYLFADQLRISRDPRIKYVISNGRIFSSTVSPWTWRKYNGSNKHDHHVHVSVLPEKKHYDDSAPWEVPLLGKVPSVKPEQ